MADASGMTDGPSGGPEARGGLEPSGAGSSREGASVAAAAPRDTPAAGPRGEAVVVDDDPLHVILLTRRLRRASFDVKSFDDGASALHHLADECPDHVFLDLRMPGMDGERLLRELLSAGRVPASRISVCSAFDPPPDVAERLRRAGSEVILKDRLITDEGLAEALGRRR